MRALFLFSDNAGFCFFPVRIYYRFAQRHDNLCEHLPFAGPVQHGSLVQRYGYIDQLSRDEGLIQFHFLSHPYHGHESGKEMDDHRGIHQRLPGLETQSGERIRTVAVGLYQMLDVEYIDQWFCSFAAGEILILFIALLSMHGGAAGIPDSLWSTYSAFANC